MFKKIFLTAIVFLLVTGFSYAEDSIKMKPIEFTKKKMRNRWNASFIYTDKGFGLGAKLFKPVSQNTDFEAGIMFAGVKDPQENEVYDYYGNSFVYGKINRVLEIPVSIGLQHYIFTEDLDDSFRPFLSIGASPTLVLMDPYYMDFFKALGYISTAFAFGPYAGIGLEYNESSNMSFCANLRYSYLPVLVNTVQSLKDKDIKDVGGIQIMLGVNFLK
jgi:hypothetical protein